jgi:hypothetical protein
MNIFFQELLRNLGMIPYLTHPKKISYRYKILEKITRTKQCITKNKSHRLIAYLGSWFFQLAAVEASCQ